MALLNTAASLESVGRVASRIWTDAEDWTADEAFMDRLSAWCENGRIVYDNAEVRMGFGVTEAHEDVVDGVLAEIRRRRVLALMLGDTSMGMINGYFGPRLLTHARLQRAQGRPGLADRPRPGGRRPPGRGRLRVRQGPGRHLPLAGARRRGLRPRRRPEEQLRGYLAVLDLAGEFRADCLGWQYQLGLLNLLPPSDFAEGLLNSHARPEGDGRPLITATEADQGNLVPMELMKRLLEAKGLPGAVMFHDVRWGAAVRGPIPLGPPE